MSRTRIEFEFFWVELPEGVPVLSGNQGELLSALVSSVGA
jgi:hypothetical protein